MLFVKTNHELNDIYGHVRTWFIFRNESLWAYHKNIFQMVSLNAEEEMYISVVILMVFIIH